MDNKHPHTNLIYNRSKGYTNSRPCDSPNSYAWAFLCELSIPHVDKYVVCDELQHEYGVRYDLYVVAHHAYPL